MVSDPVQRWLQSELKATLADIKGRQFTIEQAEEILANHRHYLLEARQKMRWLECSIETFANNPEPIMKTTAFVGHPA